MKSIRMKKNFTYEPAFTPNIPVNVRNENFSTWGWKCTSFDALCFLCIAPFHSSN